GPRRRADRRCDQGLGRHSGPGRVVMSQGLRTDELWGECRALADRAKAASRVLANARGDVKDMWLTLAATLIPQQATEILAANARDVAAAPESGLNDAAIDRLCLNKRRLDEIAEALAMIRALPDPIGEVVTSSRRPNGLDVAERRVPLGV